MSDEAKQVVLNLIIRKEQLEKEIKEMGYILQQNGVGMDDPLVDNEGFPLASIDVYQVRHARSKIICLQNDHKAIMKEIEKGLGEYYGSATNVSSNTAPSSSSTHNDNNSQNLEAFAKVTNVAVGSPADEAGLRNDDLLVEFGSVNYGNFKNMKTIADIVQHSENTELRVRVKRGQPQRCLSIQLRPRHWPGSGMLGCLITPLDTLDR